MMGCPVLKAAATVQKTSTSPKVNSKIISTVNEIGLCTPTSCGQVRDL